MKDLQKFRERLFAELEEAQVDDSITDRAEVMRIVEEIRESENMFRKIIEASTDAIIVADEKENVHVWNPSAEKLFGYRQEEVLGRKFVKFIVPKEYRAARDRAYRKAVETRKLAFQGRILEAEGIRRDGTRFPIEHTVSMWASNSGIRFVAILRDVTERRRAREEAKKYRENLERMVDERTSQLQKEVGANKRLADIVENSDDAIIGKTLDGIIVSWNKGAERIYQYTEEEAVGRSISIVVPEDKMLEIRKIYEKLRNGERVGHFETVRKKKDGTLIDVSLTVSPIRDDEGKVIGAAAIARDITRRKRAEAEVRSIAQFPEESPNPVMRASIKGVMLYANRPALSLLEAIGWHKGGVTPEVLLHPVRRVLEQNAYQECEVVSPSGRVFSFALSPSAGEGHVNLFGRDITNLKLAEEELRRLNEELEERVETRTTELRQANAALQNSLITLKQTQDHLVQSQKMAALGEIVAGVAHEINTPVGVAVTASSYLEMKTKEIDRLLSTGEVKKSDLTQYLKRVLEISDALLNNLSRASDLVKSFKQVAVDQSHEERRKFNLNDYIRKVLLSLRPQYKRTRHVITVNCPEDLEIYSFPGAFYQIISNLVMNSLIHGFEGIDEGTIIFDIRAVGDNLVFKYSDSGRGIPKENLDKIFNPFFTTKRTKSSTGLGLHLVYNLVTQTLKGRITCRSSPGMGAEFEILIPLKG